jgi:UDP-N-acetylmuramate dehydrogenase
VSPSESNHFMSNTNTSLRQFNTFGIEVHCPSLVRIEDEPALRAMLPVKPDSVFILGGGSNMLLTRDIEKPVWKMDIPGIEVIEDFDDAVLVRIGGGVDWHAFVEWAIAHNFGGVENLSLIPGSVGAAPIQNIGAYGVELSEVFERLEAFSLSTGAMHVFDAEACKFSYRNSFFKGEGKGDYLITRVVLRLSKAPHSLNLSYGAVTDTLEKMGIIDPGIGDVSQAVVQIRQSKLPDPAVIGNSGSFFKNPELPGSALAGLLADHADLLYFPLPDGRIKVPAGWLIEQCGWKGFREGDAGCYDKQALVLVNYGDATGDQIWDLAQRIQASVEEKFGISLEPEVNVI